MTETSTPSTEAVLRQLGVRIVSVGRQIKAYCPVHFETLGREDTHPSWYMNAVTGAWLCFSCHASGSLGMLVDRLGGDPAEITRYIISNAVERITEAVSEGDDEPEDPETPFVSPYAFSKHPYPPKRMRLSRDIDLDTCKALNIRWRREAFCWMLPVYTFEGVLVGWQEKATGYFNNYPPRMPKRGSLFGYGMVSGTTSVIVVESPLDAARLIYYGYEAVAIYGSFISSEQVDALTRCSLRKRPEVILAFDHDDSGRKAAYASTPMFLDAGVFVRYFNYTGCGEGADPGDLTPGQLRKGVRTATALMPMDIFSCM